MPAKKCAWKSLEFLDCSRLTLKSASLKHENIIKVNKMRSNYYSKLNGDIKKFTTKSTIKSLKKKLIWII